MKNSDIENFDKTMPFNDTPADFFDTFPEKVLRRINQRNHRRTFARRIGTIAAAAVVGIVIALTLINDNTVMTTVSTNNTTERYADIDTYISNMSDEELDELLQMYEADVIMQMEE